MRALWGSASGYLPAVIAVCGVAFVWLIVRTFRKAFITSRPEPKPHRSKPDRELPAVKGPVWRSVLGWLLVAVVVAVSAGAALLWLLGWPKLPNGITFTTTEVLDLLKIGLAVVAGFGGVVALAVNHRKQRVTEAAHVVSLSQEQRERTKLFNERFGATTAQLGHEQAAVRLAGVYAMAGLADDWHARRQTCVEVLCAYLRLPRESAPGEREVVATIFRVLREHLGTTHRAGSWSDLDFDFTGVVFDDADFSEITFEGKVVFDGAEFSGTHASFERTAFRGTTLSCHGTLFSADVVTFQHVLFDNSDVEFVGSRFVDTSVDFGNCELQGRTIDFFRADLASTTIGFRNAVVTGGTIRFDQCTATKCDLDLTGLYPDMEPRRSFGVLVVENSEFVDSTLDLRLIDLRNTDVWLLDSTFRQVRVETDEPEHLPRREWLKVRRLDLTDSTLPA